MNGFNDEISRARVCKDIVNTLNEEFKGRTPYKGRTYKPGVE